ncbi:GNAT family N-acetyltransferase [Streptomyces sp. NPDC091280]|uniref:GNAT family N-acetyltransferase n=1 Tax=Streptomyces sp. NPDC091280 TaxID=3365984 RepID=UPI003828A41D
MTHLDVRPAGRDELHLVEALLTDASTWLASRGIGQWQYPPERAEIKQAIGHGGCLLAFRNAQPVATIQVDDHADPEFWQEDDRPETALYVHRLAVSRSTVGQGIGSKLLDWAAQHSAEAGKTLLRLDAWKDNPALHAYYLRHGFELVRIVDVPHRGSGALFQRAT